MKLSIVTTLFYSAPYLEQFYSRVCAAAQKITDNFEIIFVNDGSPDDSLKIAVSLHQRDKRVKVVDLSRNFGHHRAIMTGLSYAKGQSVFLIDCDLEEKPEYLGMFHKEKESTGADVVYGVRQNQRKNWFDNITAGLFWKMINFFSSDPIPADLITVRLMSQRYVGALLEHREREIFLGGLFVITGFKQAPLTVVKDSKNTSAYNLRRKISLAANAITSFSDKPLILIFYTGFLILFLTMIPAFYLIMKRIFFGAFLAGWPSLIISVWLLGGMIIFCLGIIGIYVAKVYMETKHRPYTIIRQVYERS